MAITGSKLFLTKKTIGNAPIGCYLVMMKPKPTTDTAEKIVLVPEKIPDLTHAPFETLVLSQIDFDNNVDFVSKLNFSGNLWLSLGDLKTLPKKLPDYKTKEGVYVFYDKGGYLNDKNNAYALPCRVAGMFFTRTTGSFPHIIYNDIVGYEGKEEKTTENADLLIQNHLNFAFQNNGVSLFSLIDLNHGEQSLLYYNEKYIVNVLQSRVFDYIKTRRPLYDNGGFAEIRTVLINGLTEMINEKVLDSFDFINFPAREELSQEDVAVQKLSGIKIQYTINQQIRFIELSIDVVL